MLFTIPNVKTASAPISARTLSMALLMANRAEQLMHNGGSPTPVTSVKRQNTATNAYVLYDCDKCLQCITAVPYIHV